MTSLKSSITVDANPEGKNQYSGAGGTAEKAATHTARAHAATEATKTRKFGTPQSRQEQNAANAHEVAAKHQHQAAMGATSEKQKEHLKQRDAHESARKFHQERANAMYPIGK